jgi:hypothetical protein
MFSTLEPLERILLKKYDAEILGREEKIGTSPLENALGRNFAVLD